MESAIETSDLISVKWLCALWESRPANEMEDLLHGFFMLDNSHNVEMREEVRFLKALCWKKHYLKRCEELMRAAA